MAEGGEKTEKATPKRRQEARNQGTVAKSQDLVGALGTLVLLLTLPIAASIIGNGAVNAVKRAMHDMPATPVPGQFTGLAIRSAQPMLGGLALLLAVAVGVAVIANIGQVGFKITPEALAPKFEKINPMSGFKRMLSKQGAMETAKGLVKTLLFGYLAYGVLRNAWPDLMNLGRFPLGVAFSVVAGVLKDIGFRIVPVWFVLACVDYGVQWKRVEDQMKMTKEEVKREAKEQQMSPEVYRERARRQRQMAKGGMMKAVKTADVIITNPTHYAIAIKYEHGKHAAPIVVAKGVDFLAAKIREEAKAHRVPLVPNPPLARALYKQCEIGDQVPHELFRGVAEVLAYVYRTLRRVQA
ncbi:EscU/YscU/HrcU family type III secretion system export apparatus switch protein [bacterium]|nr:MAG: EscU/YscU/HrcU family type III secretion system export apparatus switch protein [bacterium]